MAMKQFKAESKRLLDLMIHSIYTHQEIFLRELISNASDAIDKLYYKSLQDGDTGLNRDDFCITIDIDKENRNLIITDNGCGMTKEELALEIVDRLKKEYPDILDSDVTGLPDAMSIINQETGNRFIVIIDEWDVLIRDEAANKKVQESYINFLRAMFKGTEPTKYIQLAYLTGILPIKKEKTQSALNNFNEFTMLDAGVMAPYIGFTEEEVKELCERYHRDFEKVKYWYDGYLLEDYQVYNPKAVVSVSVRGKFRSYWSETASYEAIVPLINMNYDGLKNSIIEILSGASIKVNTTAFKNDTVNIQSKDDVLTYLIHLGYLGYDQNRRTAFVPNEEIRQELTNAVKSRKWNEMITFQQESERLLEATLDMDEEAVAEGIENEMQLEFLRSISCDIGQGYYFAKPMPKKDYIKLLQKSR